MGFWPLQLPRGKSVHRLSLPRHRPAPTISICDRSAKSDEAHVHDFESLSFTIDEPLDSDRVRTFFDSLPKSLLRAKGVLSLYRDPSRRTTYQRVGSRSSLSPAERWGDEKPHSSLVFIGPTGSLDASALKGGLDDCVVSRR